MRGALKEDVSDQRDVHIKKDEEVRRSIEKEEAEGDESPLIRDEGNDASFASLSG